MHYDIIAIEQNDTTFYRHLVYVISCDESAGGNKQNNLQLKEKMRIASK